MSQLTKIYVDGACSGNPGPGGWGAILILPNQMIQEIGGGERDTTNNRMELMAVIRALEEAPPGPVRISSDSVYVIRGATEWIRGWKRKDFEGVKNADLWQRLDPLLEDRRAASGQSVWRKVPAHAGVPGNERADAIAVAFSKGQDANLYEGPEGEYGVDVSESMEEVASSTGQTKSKSAKRIRYLSLVDGRLEIHKTWGECEALVKGRAGAKYKKVQTDEEEARVLKAWGVDGASR